MNWVASAVIGFVGGALGEVSNKRASKPDLIPNAEDKTRMVYANTLENGIGVAAQRNCESIAINEQNLRGDPVIKAIEGIMNENGSK